MRANVMVSVIAARKSRNMSPMIVAVIGILVLIVGVAIATVPGTGLRGSGLGTVLIVIGVVLLLVGGWRYTRKGKVLCLLLIAALFLSPARLVGAASTLTPTSTITSVVPPTTMAYDSAKGEIFGQVGGGTSGVVEVISDSTNKVVANITEGTACPSIGCYIGDVAYDSGRGLIFAAYGGGGTQGTPALFSVISDNNNSLVTTVSWNTPGNSQYNWPTQPSGMVYDSGKGEIFVSDVGSNVPGGVWIMNASTYTFIASGIGGGQGGRPSIGTPGEMAYDPAKGEVFLVDMDGHQVSVISDSTNKLVANISVSATSLAYNPAQHEVFAYNGSSIAVISDITNQVTATIGGMPYSGSTSMAYDSGENEIFAGSVVSVGTNTVSAQLPYGIRSMVYDSGKGEMFAATSSGIDVFTDSSSSSTSTTASTSVTSTTNPHPTSTISFSSSSSGGGGGIPDFPYQLSAAAALVVILAASYLLVRSRRTPLDLR